MRSEFVATARCVSPPVVVGVEGVVEEAVRVEVEAMEEGRERKAVSMTSSLNPTICCVTRSDGARRVMIF